MSSASFFEAVSKKDGSAMVEAALVFPLLVLMIAGIVSCALYVQDHIRQDAERHRAEASEYLESSVMRPETPLRLEWVSDE